MPDPETIVRELLGGEPSLTTLTLGQVACRAVVVYAGGLALIRLGTWCACRSHAIGNLIKGHTRLLVENGKIDWKQMRRSDPFAATLAVHSIRGGALSFDPGKQHDQDA